MVSLVEDVFANSSETNSFVLDAEIVAIDPVDGSLKSFQELSNRARRDVKLDDVKVSVCVFAFDLMYLDGEVRASSRAYLFVAHYARERSSWKGRFDCAGRSFAQSFPLLSRTTRLLRNFSTCRAVRARMGRMPWSSFGKKL